VYSTVLTGIYYPTFRKSTHLENGGTEFLQDVGKYLPINTAPYPAKLECSSTLLGAPQIWNRVSADIIL
jgi:hypothetical protein